jgi:hypothetical protein
MQEDDGAPNFEVLYSFGSVSSLSLTDLSDLHDDVALDLCDIASSVI